MVGAGGARFNVTVVVCGELTASVPVIVIVAV